MEYTLPLTKEAVAEHQDGAVREENDELRSSTSGLCCFIQTSAKNLLQNFKKGFELFPFLKEGDASSKIFPRIKDLNFLSVLKNTEGMSNDSMPVTEPLVGDLILAYAFDAGSSFFFVTPSLLKEQDIQRSDLRSIAETNGLSAMNSLKFGSDGTIYQFTADDDMAACSILYPEVWRQIENQVGGPVIAAFPHRNYALFALANSQNSVSALSAYMSQLDFNDNHALSKHIFRLVDGKWHRLDTASIASNQGMVSLSEAKLKAIQPELFSSILWHAFCQKTWGENQQMAEMDWKQRFREHLKNGDGRAAIVVNASLGLVAAYSDEMDCVALLKFGQETVSANGWKNGTRLLTVNKYAQMEYGRAKDLEFGPASRGIFGNFHPIIAELLSEDENVIMARKAEIDEGEWIRTEELAKRAIGLGVKPRDGRPILSCYLGR